MSELFAQYRSLHKTFVFYDRGDITMEVYDRDNKKLGEKTFTKAELHKSFVGEQAKDCPTTLVRTLLARGYRISHNRFVSPYERVVQFGKKPLIQRVIEGAISLLAFGKNLLAIGTTQCEVKIWNTRTYQGVVTLKAAGSVGSLALLDDERIAGGLSSKGVEIWNPKKEYACDVKIKGHRASVESIAALAENKIATLSNAYVRCFDIKDPEKPIAKFQGGFTMAVLAGNRVATDSGKKEDNALVYDVTKGQEPTHILKGHENYIRAMMAYRSSQLLTASNDTTVRIWDLAEGVCVKILRGHTGAVTHLATLSTGLIVTGSLDHTIRIWDPNHGDHGTCIDTLKLGAGKLWGLTPLPDDCIAILVDLNDKRTLQIWQTRPPAFNPSKLVKEIQNSIRLLEYKLPVDIEGKELMCFLCGELYNLPARAECDHVFCNPCIQEYKKEHDRCPECCVEPIGDLVFDDDALDAVKAYHKDKTTRIPSRELFKESNPQQAKTYRSLIKKHFDSKEYEKALAAATQLLAYSNHWKDYSSIPVLLKETKRENAAVISYLYLARYQMEARAFSDAVDSLKQAHRLDQRVEPVLIRGYHLLGRSNRAINGYTVLAEKSLDHKEAMAYLERILAINPFHLQAYSLLAKKLIRSQDKAHLFLKGALHMMQKGSLSDAENFCMKARKVLPKTSLFNLQPYLDLLQKKGQLAQAKICYIDETP